MHFPHGILLFKVSNGNPRIISEMTMRTTSVTAGFQLQFIYEGRFLFSLGYIYIAVCSSVRMT